MKRLLLALAAFGLLSLTTAAQTAIRDVSFAANHDYAMSSPRGVAAGDFNGDGRADVAVTNFYSSSVTLMLSGAGLRTMAVEDYPVGIAVADFNNDSDLDLAVAEAGTNSVAIALGNGDGSFAAALHFGAAVGVASVVVADFNHDGNADLVAWSGTAAAVHLGHGDGTLAPAVPLALLTAIQTIAVADFNGDTHADIAASIAPNRIVLMRGNGTSTFQPAHSMTVSQTANAPVAGDFNGDGIQDLAASVNTELSILFGNGDFTFRLEWSIPSHGPIVAAGDFNNDARLDLVVKDRTWAMAHVVLGVAGGYLHLGAKVLAGSNVDAIAVADVNGDARTDLVLAAWDSPHPAGSIAFRYGRGDGTFPLTPGLRHNANETTVIAADDLNADGALDLIGAVHGPDSLFTVLGNGNGTFRSPPAVLAVDGSVEAMATGDFDGDSDIDVVIGGWLRGTGDITQLRLCRGRGDGSLAPPEVIQAGVTPQTAIVAAELNGDAILDLVVLNESFRTPGSVIALIGNGNGTFQNPITVFSGSSTAVPRHIAVADFNGDGIPDVATAVGNSTISLALGKGDGNFLPPHDTGFDQPLWLAAGDFNTDGHMDLAVTREALNVGVLLGNGDGTFQSERTYFTAHIPTELKAADFNRDGHTDLAVLNGSSLSILRGRGEASLLPQLTGFSTLHRPQSLIVADFTSDGRPDIAAVGDNNYPILIGFLYNTTP